MPKKHPKYLLTFFALALSMLSFAQNEARLKGLMRIAERQGIRDSTYIRLNMEIADELIFNHPDSSAGFVNMALARAEEIRDTAALAKAHNYLGIISYSRGHFLTALEHYQLSQAFYKRANDPTGALKAANNIAIVYTNLKENDKAVQIYEEAFHDNMALGNEEFAINNLYNIAVGQLELKQYDIAKATVAKLEQMHREFPESIDPSSVKAELFLMENKLDSALAASDRAYEISRKAGDDYFLTSIILLQVEIHTKKNDYERAWASLTQAEDLVTRNDFNELKLACLEKRAAILDKQGLSKAAFLVQQEFISLKDSLENINNFNRISELNAKYESEKRETEIARQGQLIEQKTSHLKLALISGVACLALAFIILWSLIRKRKLNNLLKAQNFEIKLQRQKIISSINYARKIQSSMLPPQSTLQSLIPESFIYFKPRDIVSGDFYWYQEIEGKLYMAAVDCTGHGVPGAFMSLIANSKLNKVINEMKLREPSQILRAIHVEIMEALHQENISDNAQDGMDLSLCVIDFAAKSIKFSGANNSICLVSGENVEEFKSKPVSIGGTLYAHQSKNMANPFETIEISYREGDMLYMFTDGFPDQLGGDDNKKFNKARFRQMLRKIASEQVEYAGDNCQVFLDNWRKAMPQTDDILLIGARLP